MPPNPLARKPTPVLWLRKTIQVDCHGRRRPVQAQCLGMLAVHPSLGGDGRWAVTHILTGMLTGMVGTEEDAKRIAVLLWTRWRSAYQERILEKVVESLPQEVKDWARMCKAENKYLDFPS